MSKIDTNNWLDIPIGNLFTVVKGTRLTKADMRDGNIKFIGASAINNGITAFISNDDHVHPGNTITITYNGSVGEPFYQEREFWASDDVNVLYPKFTLNMHIALFIIPLLKKAGQKYKFIDKWKKEDMEKDCVKIPVDSNHLPDYIYMEEYMKDRENVVSASLAKMQSAKRFSNFQNVDSTQWNDFSICDLFEVKNTHSILWNQIDENSGIHPYVTASECNNSVMTYISYDKAQIELGASILIGGKTMAITYQPFDYFSNDSHNLALYLKNCKKRNKYVLLFLVTSLKKGLGRIYSWGDSISGKSIRKDVIRLPVDTDGEPNWDYMEFYMKNMEQKASSLLENLTAVL